MKWTEKRTALNFFFFLFTFSFLFPILFCIALSNTYALS